MWLANGLRERFDMTRKYECIKRFSWTPENIHKLKTMAKDHSREDAAKAIGCHPMTLWKACKKFGISYRKQGEKHYSAKLSFDDVELIRDLADAGLKQKDIAEKFEVSRAVVSRIVRFKDRLTC